MEQYRKWNNAEEKRIIPIYWLSAAAVLLIATIGILLYQQQNNTNEGKQLANNTIEKPKQVVETPVVKDQSPVVVEPVKDVAPILPVEAKPARAIAKTKVKQDKPALAQPRIITAPEMQKHETTVAKVEEPKKDIRTKIEEAILQPKEETVIVANPTAIKTDDPINDNEQGIKGIRNVGDVVNLIVNKMDKRKDKLIQFRTDDDDSSLSSINIGPFKFGKKKK
ncbi:hypothetical protein [Pedobacter sp. P26]|uniref:hypothetical protein n=1 Tax=Pedobacter sp. P26 TaxID=3423956 RepID=UPI003D67CF57